MAKVSSSLPVTGSINHNETHNIQGGTIAERYHLTLAERDNANSVWDLIINSSVSNKIVVSTGITSVGLNKTLNPLWKWLIKNILYSNTAAVTISFPLASAGNQRLDRIVATTANTFIRVPGVESVSSPVAPLIPANTIDVTIVLVTDIEVSEPVIPVIGDNYVLKAESQDLIFNSGATTVVNQINLIDDRSSVSLTGAITDLKSINIPIEFIRPGKPHFIKNRSGHNIKIWNLAASGTGNIKYFFPGNQDLVIKDGEVVEFNINANNSSSVRAERVGFGKDTELSYACSDEVSDLTIGTLITFRMPIALILNNVKLSLNTAPTVTRLIVDIKKGGVSIFSTLISVDIGQTTSVGASVPAVISDINLTDDSMMTIMTTQVGSGVVGKGLKVTFIGKKI